MAFISILDAVVLLVFCGLDLTGAIHHDMERANSRPVQYIRLNLGASGTLN